MMKATAEVREKDGKHYLWRSVRGVSETLRLDHTWEMTSFIFGDPRKQIKEFKTDRAARAWLSEISVNGLMIVGRYGSNKATISARVLRRVEVQAELQAEAMGITLEQFASWAITETVKRCTES